MSPGRLRKVAVGDRDLQRKRYVCTNCTVSYWREEFDSDGNVVQLSYGKQKKKSNFGTSRLEDKVSNSWYVNSSRGSVFGG
jgi:hypothetical protein